MSGNTERHAVDARSGRIRHVQTTETGPVVHFVRGVLANGHPCRHQPAALADPRRCIAIELTGYGHTSIAPPQPVSFEARADMPRACIVALGIDRIDLVANDIGAANGANPIATIVPCHRVIARDMILGVRDGRGPLASRSGA
ncbi:MAG: hypothetical protein NFCOHLIN_00593 [Gammaproteobacteria bacterium]|nr:hypothetical protein [Gammaproteobacteria bacterium]